MNDTVKIALITVVPAAMTSFATAWATLNKAESQLNEVQTSLNIAENKAEALASNGADVPIGGVISWWGDWSDVNKRPMGYEICDGTNVITVDSPIQGQQKPKLTGRFIKGASASNKNVIASNITGGEEYIKDLKVAGTSITIAQMPAHSHRSETAVSGEHKHSTTGKSASDDAGVSADSHFALGDYKDGRDWPNSAIEVSLSGIHRHGIESEGNGETHDHQIPTIDNQPPYLEMFFLIRVK